MINLFFILLLGLTLVNTQLKSESALQFEYNDSEAPLHLLEEKQEQEEEQKKLAGQKQEISARSAQEQENETITDINNLLKEEEQETITTLGKESEEARQKESTGKISVTTTKAPTAQESLVRSVLNSVINFLKSLWAGLGSASQASTSVLLELSKQAEALDTLQKTLGSSKDLIANLPTLKSALTGIRQFISNFNQTQKTVQKLGNERPSAAFTFTARNTDEAHDFLQNQIKAFKVVLNTLVDYPEILNEQNSFIQEQLRRLHSSATQEYALRTPKGSANLYESYKNGLVSDSLRRHLDRAVSTGVFPESKTAANAERAYEVFGLPNFAIVDEVQAKWEEMGKKYSTNLSDPVYLAGREAVSIIGDPLGKSLYDSFLLARNNPILQEQFNSLALSPNSLDRLSNQIILPLQIAALLESGIEKGASEETQVKELIKQF